MPKGRHLKPEFFTDKHMVAVEPLARLLYEGLWCYAADCGHLDDEPIELKMRILPADNCDVDALLDVLADTGRVQRKDGMLYLPKLRDHARVDKRYETVCEACKEAAKHGVDTTGGISPSTPNTKGSRRTHAVDTQGTQCDHDADGDGDGDGEVMVKDAPRGAPKAHQLPDTWRPNAQHATFAAEKRLDIQREAAQFRDHHRAKGTTFKDWDAAFRTWLRNAEKWRGSDAGPVPARPSSPHVSEIESPPDGLSPQEYAAWDEARRKRRAAGR